MSGGDDVTRGKIQVNPAIVQYLWEQYTGGPGKVFSNTIGLGKDMRDLIAGGEAPEFNVRKIEGLKAFVQQGDDRTEYYRTNAKYRKYQKDAEELDNKIKNYENGAAENPEYWMKLQELQKGQDFVRMQMLKDANKYLKKLNKMANQAEGEERKRLRAEYNKLVKELVDELDDVGE
jgi:hypothetical protein